MCRVTMCVCDELNNENSKMNCGDCEWMWWNCPFVLHAVRLSISQSQWVACEEKCWQLSK